MLYTYLPPCFYIRFIYTMPDLNLSFIRRRSKYSSPIDFVRKTTVTLFPAIVDYLQIINLKKVYKFLKFICLKNLKHDWRLFLLEIINHSKPYSNRSFVDPMKILGITVFQVDGQESAAFQYALFYGKITVVFMLVFFGSPVLVKIGNSGTAQFPVFFLPVIGFKRQFLFIIPILRIFCIGNGFYSQINIKPDGSQPVINRIIIPAVDQPVAVMIPFVRQIILTELLPYKICF